MTELIYLTDSYQKELTTRVVSCEQKGQHWEIILSQTIFYPEGGGQPSDKGLITTKGAKAHVKHVRLKGDTVIHECSIEGTISKDEEATCQLDWDNRFHNMRVHSAGHIVHEATIGISPQLIPVRGEHGAKPYIEYEGSLPIDKTFAIEKEANAIIAANEALTTEFVSLEQLISRAAWVPQHLPKNKPLRILTVGTRSPIPDGGTQIKTAGEIGPISITSIENTENNVRVYYQVETMKQHVAADSKTPEAIPAPELTRMLMDVEASAKLAISTSLATPDVLRLELLGAKSDFAQVTKNIKYVPIAYRQEIGKVINFVKEHIEEALVSRGITNADTAVASSEFVDVTMPGIRPMQGHLHIVTQAIMEITQIFERIGFTRVRHPEVDWDWYPFESLNMPPSHPARDEWETFFLQYPGKPGVDSRKQKIVLTPHTSNGQVREMEKGNLPIRMINIAKCYRRQIDVSHTPMFHQFEGLYVDHDVSIGHLKGVFDYFVKQFFGASRTTRLRPFHFQFTEPSFEVDINCGICLGSGTLADNTACRLCKAGWLELGGAGMVHPVVLRNGGIDPDEYSGFAFGWGIERTSMMKSGTKLDDIRLLYSNDVRFLEQF